MSGGEVKSATFVCTKSESAADRFEYDGNDDDDGAAAAADPKDPTDDKAVADDNVDDDKDETDPGG